MKIDLTLKIDDVFLAESVAKSVSTNSESVLRFLKFFIESTGLNRNNALHVLKKLEREMEVSPDLKD